MAKPLVGVQLIVFGEQPNEDLGAVLAAVARAGYDGVEIGMPASQKQVDEMRMALSDSGLSLMGAHSGFVSWDDSDVVSQRISAVKDLGGRFAISSGRFKTLEEYREAARLMNQVGKQCLDAGLIFCYHNHAWEFTEMQGEKPIHMLMTETDPRLVSLCPDVYWVDVGGEKPATFIARYQERCPCFHFKDGLGGRQFREFRELGQGNMDLPAALEAALACDPEWIVTEQDQTKLEPAESVRISREYLRRLGV